MLLLKEYEIPLSLGGVFFVNSSASDPQLSHLKTGSGDRHAGFPAPVAWDAQRKQEKKKPGGASLMKYGRE